MIQDEASGFFGRMEKYSGSKGGAADRSFWLQTYNGGEYRLDRVQRGVHLIENLSMSFVGGIQPEALRAVSSGAADDGLIQRFIPVPVAVRGDEVDEPIGQADEAYAQLLEKLRKCPEVNILGSHLKFSDDAARIRQETARHYKKLLRGIEIVNRKLASHLGKYDGMFARLSIVYHVVENINSEYLPPEVSGKTARQVANLMRGYMQQCAFHVYMGVLDAYDDKDVLIDVAGYILAHGKTDISRRDFQRATRLMKRLQDRDIAGVMEQLAAFGWVYSAKDQGARSGISWDVNPEVHRLFSARAKDEAERRADVRAAIANMAS